MILSVLRTIGEVPTRKDPADKIHRETISEADRLFSELQFVSALKIYTTLLRQYPRHDSVWFRMVNNVVECYYWQHECDTAETIIRENIPQAVKALGIDHPQVGNLYLNLAITGFISSNPSMTEEYFQKALRMSVARFGLVHPNTARIYEWLGAFHESFKDKENCYYYLHTARAIREKAGGPDNLEMGNVYRYLALYHKRFARHDSSKFYLKKALTAFDTKYGKNNFQSVKCLNNLCNILEDAGKFGEASALYKEIFDRIAKARGEIRMTTVMSWFNYADFFARQGDYIRALQTFQRTYFYLFPGFNKCSYLDNPLDIDNAQNNYLRYVYEYKSNYLIKAIEKHPALRPLLLKTVLQCDSLAAAFSFRQRLRIANQDNRLAFEQARSNLYSSYADHALEMYAIDPDSKYLSAAISYLEKYRNTQKVFRMQLTGEGMENEVHGSLPADFARLQKEINELNSQLVTVVTREQKKRLENTLIDKKIALDQSFYWFSQKSRENWQRMKDIRLDARKVQECLRRDEAIFYLSEYFPDYYDTPKDFTLLMITRDKVRWKTYKGEELYPGLIGFLDLLKSPATPEKRIDIMGFALYRKLFAPFTGLLKGKRSLIIVPSPDTWLIPFEALAISNTEKDPQRRYLLSRFVTQKVFSLAAWLDQEKQPVKEPVLLAMAPKFNKNLKTRLARVTRRDTAMIDLPGARYECQQISRIFPSTLVEGYGATKNQFKQLAPRYDIIHLSTHGIGGEGNQQFISLAFNNLSDSSSFDGNLNLYEILNLQLKTRLVVLSACKSGIGAKNKSEGNLNLAWAFRNAGTRSVVVSIWDANDYTSSRIMPQFYHYLSDGHSKPEALRDAKRDYLRQADQLMSHPYYWAGFDFMGDGAPLVVSPFPIHWLNFTIGAVILLPVMLFLLYKLLKRTRRVRRLSQLSHF